MFISQIGGSLKFSTLKLSQVPTKSAFYYPRAYYHHRVFAVMAEKIEQIKKCKDLVSDLIKSTNANPILIRLAWHDSGTYDKRVTAGWPAAGGANASIRFDPEIMHGANAGLRNAIKLLEPIKAECPEVSYSDLFQMASALAVEIAGGPEIPLKYGRMDVDSSEDCAPEGNLPAFSAPFPDGSETPAEHLRRVFHRMGFTDGEIVALSGAHTLGRAYKNRSGATTKDSTIYTKDGPGTKGGQSWTAEWLKFDNSYFVEVKAKRDEELLVLPTDAALFEDEGFKPFAEKYADDEEAFFEDYSKAHVKLSELGVKWVDDKPICLN